MWRATGMGVAAAILLGTLVSGCAVQCGSNPDKLAALRRGMTYADASKIMGCPGAQVSVNGPDSGEASTMEWDGPESIVFMRTQLDFLDGRLLFFTTTARGGL